ncbi:MAG: hypothetical protein U0401_17535 [Anaerolineae bacterium]
MAVFAIGENGCGSLVWSATLIRVKAASLYPLQSEGPALTEACAVITGAYGHATYGEGIELDVIASIVLGGPA